MNIPLPDKNRQVLVIDDNRAIHDDFRKILCPAGLATKALNATEAALFGDSKDPIPPARFEVDSAYQGQDGVRLVEEAFQAGRPYAVAFVDVRMPPGLDGVETTAKLWELDPNLQVVLCTAYSDYSWEEMFEKLGQSDGLLILKKPFDAVEAFQMAHALTEKWWLHQQSKRRMEELESHVAVRTQELANSLSMLRESNEKFHQLADNITDAFWIRSADMREVQYVSRAFEEIWGRSIASLQANPQQWIEFILPEDRERVLAEFAALTRDKRAIDIEYRIVRPSGEIRWIRVRGFNVRDSADNLIRHIGIVTDMTERKGVEAQLFQSQKMETVGRLAGGIAHEFNSILTAIIGRSELLFSDLPPGSPLVEHATEISKAATRVAALTRQLLAYGRRQFLRTETLDLNQIVARMDGMLRNLMGAAVEVRIVPDAGLRTVKADVGQIEQVIINLAINARDAMPGGGKLTLETANVSIEQGCAGHLPELKPGDYAMLTITDTGAGMTEEVKARAFEPFFTTKDIGRGPGLGLSTCYGILKQSGGHICVLSEPGRGATFKIYLPQVKSQTKDPIQRLDSPELPRGTETILLIEQDRALREMMAALLTRLGYTVFAVPGGAESLRTLQERGTGHVDLLLVDGDRAQGIDEEWTEGVRTLSPQTSILLASASAGNDRVHQGLLIHGAKFLQKPFSPSDLAHKLREVLDQPVAPKRVTGS